MAGIKTGDVVALKLGNNAINLILSGIIGRAGAVLFSIGSSMKAEEISNGLKDANAKILITDAEIASKIDIPVVHAKDIFQDRGNRFEGAAPGGNIPFVLVQTSGTTGKPKMFYLTHSDLICRSARQCAMVGVTPLERISVLSPIALFTSRAHYCYILRAGAAAVIPTFSSPDECVSFLRRKEVNHVRIVASHLLELLALANEDEPLLPGLKTLAVAGAPITAAQRQAARERISPNFIEQYASNETGVLAYADAAGQKAHPDGVGWLVDGVELQIVDDAGVEVPTGEFGLARFKGHDFPTSYLNDNEATAKAFRDGWYYTGDVARVSKDNYLFLQGRADDVINNASIKYYPIEIENVLLRHPAVAEAAVFPWPHKIAGQVTGAAVVVKADTNFKELRAYCVANLPDYMVPHVIHFMDALPKNSMGKVLKRELAAEVRNQMQAGSDRRESEPQ